MFLVVFLTDAESDRVQGKNRAVLFQSTSWFSHDINVSCFNNREKVCISYGLCALSAILSVVACLLLIYQRCCLRKQITADAATCAAYCFLGNLCHSFGAFLSKQLAFQVIMGAFWAALDVVTFLAVLLPVCLFFHSKKGERMMMMKRRRRQNLLSVCLLLIMAGGGIHLTVRSDVHPDTTPSRRRLLGAFVNDRLELLGYILGLLSFVISWTSRFPAILKAFNGKRRGTVHAVVGILYAVAGALYTTAILVHDTRLAFVIKALPWIMSSVCWGVLELLILVFSLSRDRCVRHQTVRSLSSDQVALLGATSVGGNHTGKAHRKLQDKEGASPLSPTANRNLHKRTDMGRYMDVNIPVVRKVCLKEVRISNGGQSKTETMKTTVKVLRVDETCSSGSSSDSDLEVSSHFLTRQLPGNVGF
ncbi:transmembrane protein 44 isoform X2 [Clupea harengus]|uniref:Transmembrane protein 44 isoform X2 n=1 Tax=Clupea harengus TaxID=7950 RepID=A0A6P8G4V1_CLUHA|nr:transmembrane protein 44 isoform X2 [Clupea harengus]